MRNLWFTAVAVAGVVFSPLAVAGFNEGVAAFEGEHYEQALAELLPLAQAGDISAMSYVGLVYDEGQDDIARALPWYQRAAARNEPRAEARLGELYDQGKGVPQDTQKALDWYERAAAQGNDEAQAALGDHYHNDLDDSVNAAYYYGLAAAQGNADAQYALGLMLLGERGVPADIPRAWMYFTLAASDSDDAAQARDVLELRMKTADLASGKRQLDAWNRSH
jgi:TPR repeat protein